MFFCFFLCGACKSENFIEQAFEKGAIGAFCTKNLEINNTKILLKVPDTLIAYLELAKFRREKLNFTVVAITGSSGKTTTKEIVASTLESKFKVFKTPLNHNNEIGLCQTIFETPQDTEVLVLEMGMRGLGEIELLSKYALPDITIISICRKQALRRYKSETAGNPSEDITPPEIS